jgi:hypothetical protein
MTVERQWYLSRNGHVFGPVTDETLAQSAATGRILPTDQLNVAGQPDWWLASAIPGLLPVPQPALVPVPVNPAPKASALEPVPTEIVETRTLRLTCFACFREVTVEVEAGTPTVNCPRCRALLETGEPQTTAPASTNQAAFAALESPRAFKERMQKKVADAQAPAGRDPRRRAGSRPSELRRAPDPSVAHE